jgi:hypothetical protein
LDTDPPSQKEIDEKNLLKLGDADMIAGYNHVVCANLMKAMAQKKRPAPFNLVKLFTLCKTSKLISG